MSANDYKGSSDIHLLEAVLDVGALTEVEFEAFESMRVCMEHLNGITAKQRNWLESVACRYDVAPPAANLAKSVPAGRPTPAIDDFLSQKVIKR